MTVDAETMRSHFLGWQCRLRQHSIRHMNGMPTGGLRPDIVPDGAGTAWDGVTVLLVRKQPEPVTREFRHMVMRTRDPKQRFDSALKYMSETYYQHPAEFSDGMTALFGPGSQAAAAMVSAGKAVLLFEEKNQKYKIPCAVAVLDPESPDWQATFWHNHLFNPNLSGDCQVLRFLPDWENAVAEPDVY